MEKYTNHIRSLRTAIGFSQSALSAESGVNVRQIQKYESGELDVRKMALKNAIALADVLECDVRELL